MHRQWDTQASTHEVPPLPTSAAPGERMPRNEASVSIGGQVSYIWRQKRAGEEKGSTCFLSPCHADHCKIAGAHWKRLHLHCQVWYNDSSSLSKEHKQVSGCGSERLLAAWFLLGCCSTEGCGHSCIVGPAAPACLCFVLMRSSNGLRVTSADILCKADGALPFSLVTSCLDKKS